MTFPFPVYWPWDTRPPTAQKISCIWARQRRKAKQTKSRKTFSSGELSLSKELEGRKSVWKKANPTFLQVHSGSVRSGKSHGNLTGFTPSSLYRRMNPLSRKRGPRAALETDFPGFLVDSWMLVSEKKTLQTTVLLPVRSGFSHICKVNRRFCVVRECVALAFRREK